MPQSSPASQQAKPQTSQMPPTKRIGGFLAQLAEGARRFPATIALAAVAAVGFALLWHPLFEGDGYPEAILTLIVSGSVGAIVGVPVRLAFERSEKDGKPIPAALIPVVAALFAACMRGVASGAGREALFFLGCAGAGICAVAAALFLLTASDNAEGLFAHIVCAAVLASFVSSLLQAGLMVCLLAFSTLISELDAGVFLSVSSCASSIVFALVMCSQLPKRGQKLATERPYRIIACYVILPICLLLLTVLYGYIVRILIEHEMPSGTMNWFGSIALLVEIALWLGLQPIAGKPAQLFVRWGWALVLPVTAVQIYGVYVRVSAYGLTALRAGGLVCLLVGLCAIAIQALGKSPRLFYAVLGASALIFTVSPANVLDIAYSSQSARFSSALEELAGGATETARERLTSSWDYLCYAERGYFSFEQVEGYRARWGDEGFEELFGVDPYYGESEQGDHEEPVTYYRSFVDRSHVNVDGFSSFYGFDASTDKTGAATIPDASASGSALEVDAGPIIDALVARTDVEDYETLDLSGTGELVIELGDGKRVVLTSVDIFFQNGEIGTVYLEGYVLLP